MNSGHTWQKWQAETLQNQQYWLVDPLSSREPLQFFYQHGGGDGIPLFTASCFSDHQDQGPWLLPLWTLKEPLPEEQVKRGIFLSAAIHTEILTQHLKQLLVAVMEGQEVLFRYYDPAVLAPLLDSLDLQQFHHLSGPIATFCFYYQRQWVYKANPIADDYFYQSEHYFRLQPDDFNSQYQVKNHAYLLERRLWQNLPELLATVNASQIIEEQLIAANQHKVPYEKAECWAMAALLKHSNVTLEQLLNTFYFSPEEQTILHERSDV